MSARLQGLRSAGQLLLEETVRWHCLPELPDADITVLIYAPELTEPVWLGWYDGVFWFADNADELPEGAVKAWAEIPAGPPALRPRD